MLIALLLIAILLLIFGFTSTLKFLLILGLIALVLYIVTGVRGGRWY